MTLEQSSETKTGSTGTEKVTTKRTVRSFYAKGAKETTTPWGVTLKPVPRKKVVEETTKKSDIKPTALPPKHQPDSSKVSLI